MKVLDGRAQFSQFLQALKNQSVISHDNAVSVWINDRKTTINRKPKKPEPCLITLKEVRKLKEAIEQLTKANQSLLAARAALWQFHPISQDELNFTIEVVDEYIEQTNKVVIEALERRHKKAAQNG